jgi:hypothetical protein
MVKNLNEYIDRIDHYLSVKEGREDILNEIRSHILEKCEKEGGLTDHHTLSRIIEEYGHPREVAERYNEEVQIIAPAFKRHLFRYTAALFSFQFVLTIITLFTNRTMVVFPFFVIPRMDTATALMYIPMSLVYDLGLVGLFLYFVTQKNPNLRLPWVKVRWDRISHKTNKRAKPVKFIILSAVLALLLFGLYKQGTLFVYSLNAQGTRPLLQPGASQLFSWLVIALLAFEIVTELLRLGFRGAWVDVINNAVWLGAAWWMLNYPRQRLFEPGLPDKLADLLATLGMSILIVIAVFAAYEFLKALLQSLAGRSEPNT